MTTQQKFIKNDSVAQNLDTPTINKQEIDDITKLVDDFWDKVENEKQKNNTKVTNDDSIKLFSEDKLSIK